MAIGPAEAAFFRNEEARRIADNLEKRIDMYLVTYFKPTDQEIFVSLHKDLLSGPVLRLLVERYTRAVWKSVKKHYKGEDTGLLLSTRSE